MTPRRLRPVVLAAALAVGMAAIPCGAAEPPRALEPVRCSNVAGFDAVYVAAALGWFAEEGIRIEWVGQVPEDVLPAAVAAGSVDFATRHMPVVLQAIAAGAPLRIVAAGARSTREHPHMRYLVRASDGLATLGELRREVVGVSGLGSCAEHLLREALTRIGTEGEVRFAVVPEEGMAAALRAGTIDVAALHAPLWAEPLTDGARSILDDGSFDGGVPGVLPYFTREALVRERPDLVRRFVKVLARAADWANAHPDEAALVASRASRLDPRFAPAMQYAPHALLGGAAPVQWWIDRLVRAGKLRPGRLRAADVASDGFNPHMPGPVPVDGP
jgi:ABC-type nitrate/sulfonate/bicarbonate transport system substrate-binding protein